MTLKILKITVTFLLSRFFTKQKNQHKNVSISRTKRAFGTKQKASFSSFLRGFQLSEFVSFTNVVANFSFQHASLDKTSQEIDKLSPGKPIQAIDIPSKAIQENIDLISFLCLS